MLKVMKASSAELSASGGDPGILLNYWNKSSPLIKELERTVNFAERKYGDLMQQLNFYKEYYEKWAQNDRICQLSNKKNAKKFSRKTSDFGSSSENELEKANQYFCKKIKSKINEMNNEITQANRKVHSKNENFSALFKNEPPSNFDPKADPQEGNNTSFLTIENKTCKSEPAVSSCDAAEAETGVTKVTGKQSSKSIPTRNKVSRGSKRDLGASKKRCGSLQRYKIRSKSLPQGVRRKFGFGGFFEVLETESTPIKSRSKSRSSLRVESYKGRKSKTRFLESWKQTPKSLKHRITKSKSDVRQCLRKESASSSQLKKNENFQKKSIVSLKPSAKEMNTCTAVVPSNCIPSLTKAELDLNDNLRHFISKPNSLLPFLRNPIPFIPCSSTSRSFNLGLNVQQVLSLIKRKRNSVTLQAIVRSSVQAARSITEPTVDTLFIRQTTTSHSHATSAICPARECSEDDFSIMTGHRSKCNLLKQVQLLRSQDVEENVISPRESTVEITKLERPEDVWVVEQPDATSRQIRNSRSRCTCFPSKHCVDYNKVLRQYTGWRLPDPPTSCPCTKPKMFGVPGADSAVFTAGDNDGRTEVMKVHDDVLNLTRKYSSLQKQISQNSLDDCEANAELDAMESELAIREFEFKDILNFYNQLIMLKEKLRSLRSEVGNRGGARQPRRNPLRPTPSMALAKVLKKIQGLQDKIKLIDSP